MLSQSTKLRKSELPEEILLMIFKYLSVNERKAAKLVCKFWFEICNLPSLSNEEVLNCLGVYQLSDIFELLCKSERKWLNLKFQHVRFKDDSSFWENNGSRIQSIDFANCYFYEHAFEDILTSCKNLIHLSIMSSRSHDYMYYDSINEKIIDTCPFSDLMGIVDKGIVRENLNSLKIASLSTPCSDISSDIMHNLFSVFPRIKILKVVSYESNHADVLTVVMNYLMKSTDQIEVLKLHLPYISLSSSSEVDFLVKLSAMKRLRELSVSFLSEMESTGKFLHSKPLETFAYKPFRTVEQSELESLLLNSNVEHFKHWASMYSLTITKPIFEKLKSPRLKSCKLFSLNRISVQDPESFGYGSSAISRPPPRPVLSVHIYKNYIFPFGSDADNVQFLQSFQNMHHLQLDRISYDELLSLFKYQKKLKSFTTNDDDSLTFPWASLNDYVVSGVFQNTFNQLTNIERLELSQAIAYLFLRTLSPESSLVNLKYLKISLAAYADDNKELPLDLLKLAYATPFLEALYVHECRDHNSSLHCVTLCTKLSKLRFLRWDDTEFDDIPAWTDEQFRELFTVCPSLRVLFYASSILNGYKYIFDTINKKVIWIEHEDITDLPHTFAKPRIAGHVVDWLKF